MAHINFNVEYDGKVFNFNFGEVKENVAATLKVTIEDADGKMTKVISTVKVRSENSMSLYIDIEECIKIGKKLDWSKVACPIREEYKSTKIKKILYGKIPTEPVGRSFEE